MKTPAEIQQLITDKKNDLFRRRPVYAVYESIGFIDVLQKLELISLDEAYNHSFDFTERF